MVITSTTGNRVVAKSGSRVRISPTPPKTKPPNRVVFVFAMGEIRSPVVICRRHITSPVRRLVISSIFVPQEQRCKRISPALSGICSVFLGWFFAWRSTTAGGHFYFRPAQGAKMQTNLSYSDKNSRWPSGRRLLVFHVA